MAITKSTGTSIRGVISVLPDCIEDNLELDALVDTDREALVSYTGIRYRRKVRQESTDVKMLFKSGIEALLPAISWDKAGIDVIICVTQTSSITVPSISCQIHGDLGFSQHVIAYDINSGCSGFVYGLHTIYQLLASIDKKVSRALLCCGDISSALTDENDLAVRPIFSDAVSVTALEYDRSSSEESYFNLETMGEGQGAIYTESTLQGNKMRLDGIDVFNYSVQFVPNNIKSLLSHVHYDLKYPDAFIFHQANQLIIEHIRKSMKVDSEKVPYSLYEYGNTASASIPLTITTELANVPEKNGYLLLCGFGVGFSVGSALIKFDRNTILQPINVPL